MGLFVSMPLFKFLVALELSFLFLMSFSSCSGSIVAGEADVEGFEAIMSPYPLVKRPLRARVAVQGVVYCKSCNYTSYDTLLGASPLPGAVVKLQCNNTRKPITVEGTTDKKGYFFVQAPKKVSTYGVHKCKVFLVSSPLATCKNITNLNRGLVGASLRYQKPTKPVPFALYSVGPFAFAPTCYPQ